MIDNDNQSDSRQSPLSWKKSFNLIKDYFVNSDEKLTAWLLLTGIILCVVAIVALMATFAWWSAGFWAVLTAKTFSPFLVCIGQFALIVAGIVSAHVIKGILIGKLSILWRNWLTTKIINSLFEGENNYLDLKRFPRVIDNMAQRVQEDVQTLVNSTLNLGSDFLRSVLSLGTFVGTLWVVGGPLAFTLLGLNVVIPGYLIWVAFIIALAATVTTHFIARSLAGQKQISEQVEADLRQDLEMIQNDAENIAEEHAEQYYRTALTDKIKTINDNANQKLNTQSRLVAFQNFYQQASGILPVVLSAPLYFSGLIELGQLMQISMAFGQVSSSLSWFVESYEGLVAYKTSIERVVKLQDAFEKDGLIANPKSISRVVKNKETLKISNLTLLKPAASSTECMMRHLKLKLTPGEHTLITGSSGLGKSTLFKAISGTWSYGEGRITVPAGRSLYFLPQKPTLPDDTLRAVLAYPEPVSTYTEEQYLNALKAVGDMDDFISQLDEHRAWSKELSPGQGQRISLAKALLRKPDWLFLDESTASLDEESEYRVYTALKELKDTTIVSIAHRSTVKVHHSRVLFFRANNEKEITIEELAHAPH